MTGRDFLSRLSCPYCRSKLVVASVLSGDDTEVEHATIACDCYEYPIVDGIVVLRQLSGLADTVDVAVERLRAGDLDGARDHLVVAATMVPSAASPPSGAVASARRLAASARRRLTSRLGSTPSAAPGGVAPVRTALERARPPAFASYLYQRYANPSFIASIPMMSLLSAVERPRGAGGRPTVLDLGCGIGHSTAMMRTLFPDMAFVAADPDFVNLELLREHFVDDAVCVCLDAELPLPFADGQFDALFCLDAFHYIRSKWALARELERCVEETGIWILPHLHNSLVPNISRGIPLDPTGYRRLFEFADPALFDESVLLEQFMVEHAVDFGEPPPVDRLDRTPDLAMYATRRTAGVGRHEVGRRLTDAAARARLGVNPIYSIEARGGELRLRMAWPDADLERECAAVRRHLPDEIGVDLALVARTIAGTDSDDDRATIADLVRSLVLLPLPPGYHDLSASVELATP